VRTTITVADDVAAALDRLRREEGLGPSEALTLARRGMARAAVDVSYHHRPAALGLKLDVGNIGEIIDLLDQDGSDRDPR
jgi:hypothetical protein